MSKFDCFKCKHKNNLPGNTHICCKHPSTESALGALAGMLQILSGQMPDEMNKLNIKGNEHGIKSGWFNWPIDFDPLWLENCDGFEDIK